MPNPSSMNRLKRTDQTSLRSELHFSFHSCSSIAMYIFVNMGATFFPLLNQIFVENIRHQKPLDYYLEQGPVAQ